jgi:hypothetical protein
MTEMARKPKLESGLDRHQRQARERGYTGEWPPKKPTLNTVDDVRAMLTEMSMGDHRTSKATAIGSRALAFFENMQPDDMRNIAQALLDVAEGRKNCPRPRIAAINSALRLLRDISRLLPMLGRTGQTELRNHLEGLVDAFLEKMGKEEFARLSRVLILLTKRKATASERVFIISRTLKMVTETLEMSIHFARAAREPAPPLDKNDPQIQEARAEFDAMMKRIAMRN